MIQTVNRWRFNLIQFFLISFNQTTQQMELEIKSMLLLVKKVIVFVLYNRGPTPLQQL